MDDNKPTNYLDAWRAGAKFAIRKLAEKPQNFLTEGFREIVLMHAAQESIKQRDKIRSRAELADHDPGFADGINAPERNFFTIAEGDGATRDFLRGGFKEGAEFVLETVREYDIAFLTDLTMADSMHFVSVAVNKQVTELFP